MSQTARAAEYRRSYHRTFLKYPKYSVYAIAIARSAPQIKENTHFMNEWAWRFVFQVSETFVKIVSVFFSLFYSAFNISSYLLLYVCRLSFPSYKPMIKDIQKRICLDISFFFSLIHSAFMQCVCLILKHMIVFFSSSRFCCFTYGYVVSSKIKQKNNTQRTNIRFYSQMYFYECSICF